MRGLIFHQLIRAYKSCKRGKNKSPTIARFEMRIGRRLHQLEHEIQNQTYKPSPLKCFAVSHPKPREIFAAPFKDRIVHHLIVKPLEERLDQKFSPNAFACRKNKGALAALDKLKAKVRSLSKGGRSTVWCLQLDIQSFFVTIDRKILLQLYLNHTQNPLIRYLITQTLNTDTRIGAKIIHPERHAVLIDPKKSWFHQGPGQGVPIGNLTSQFGSNLYLNAWDHFIERQLKPMHYQRYMDDLLLLDTDPQKLKAFIKPIDEWLQQNRNQKLNPRKTKLASLRKGIIYLGFFCRQVDEPKDPLLVLLPKNKKWNFVQEIRRLENQKLNPVQGHHPLSRPSRKNVRNKIAGLNSYLGLATHAKTFNFRKQALQKLKNKTTENFGLPKNLTLQWCPIKISKKYTSVKIK